MNVAREDGEEKPEAIHQKICTKATKESYSKRWKEDVEDCQSNAIADASHSVAGGNLGITPS